MLRLPIVGDDEDEILFTPSDGMRFYLTTFPEHREVPGFPVVSVIFENGLVDLLTVITVEYLH